MTRWEKVLSNGRRKKISKRKRSGRRKRTGTRRSIWRTPRSTSMCWKTYWLIHRHKRLRGCFWISMRSRPSLIQSSSNKPHPASSFKHNKTNKVTIKLNRVPIFSNPTINSPRITSISRRHKAIKTTSSFNLSKGRTIQWKTKRKTLSQIKNYNRVSMPVSRSPSINSRSPQWLPSFYPYSFWPSWT